MTGVLDRRIGQQLTDRFNHAKGNTDVEITAQRTDFHVERRRDHDIVRGRGDVGEFDLQFRTDVLDAQFINAAPGIFISIQRQRQHAFNHALFGVGEFTTFYFGRETAIAAKQVIHRDKHQARGEHK